MMPVLPARLMITVCLAAALPAPLRAQDGAGDEAARAAQADFERLRVRHLPWGRPAPRSPGDEIVGRFVLLEDGDEGWEPRPEPVAVTRGRTALLMELDRAAAGMPGDGWIEGTRIRYLVEAGRHAAAIEAAAACRAERWWCHAISGYARHAAGDYTGADAAFDRALKGMPAATAESWQDLGPLLDREAARVHADLAPGARDAFGRRLWWLADPLWSLPGNDRRTEHFARHVLDRLQEGAGSPFGVRWGGDLREILIRYGWPAGWERVRAGTASLGGAARPSIVGMDPPAERHFLPPWEVLAAPTEVPLGGWPLDEEGERTSYAPAYAARRFVDLDHQLAVFRRGESAVVVAGYDLSRDSLPAGARVEAALAVQSDPEVEPVIARSRSSLPIGSVALDVALSPAVVSIEVQVRGEGEAAGIAGRARYGLPLRGSPGGGIDGRPAVSDLLLLDRPASLPVSLASASLRARGSVRVMAGERVGLYWEVYPPIGPSSGGSRGGGEHEADFSIRLRDERGGFWRGLGSAIGLVDRNAGDVALEWSEVVPPGAVYPRALAITLPDLPPGAFALELEVRFASSGSTRAVRAILVEE